MTLRGFKISVEEGAADVTGTAWGLKTDAEPEDGIELPQSHTRPERRSYFLQRNNKRFPEMQSTPGGAAAMKTVETATKDWEHHINSAGEATARFERADSNSESFTVSKMIQRNHERKSPSTGQTSLFQEIVGASLVIQWLRLHTPNARGPGLMGGQESRSHMLQQKIPHATTNTRCRQTDIF